ncbi:PGN_0703 family putative restriction endonuclease [Sphingomonas jatrophae]|uniref:PD-(D/E)XK nuclease-like domain-containing protein n=1 Tax=Sphingomonas jatrophae TaxID=1166337 RepID=A0A1I6L2K6_9SPHN|nr:hypothetical protein [Sphingomonas jatrophae]SFR97695.1 hypothetical protein SAMN05192580_2195 [Sphingomonas jatrophae]
MERTHLPLIPEPILRRHHVLENHDNRFRTNVRLLQAFWRTGRELRIGRHTAADGTKRLLGSRISNTAGRAGGNFMSAEIARLVYREHTYREPWSNYDEQRLWTNLLSSQPLVFNAFGPLRLDPTLATAMLRAICPDLADATADAVLFEHSPGRGVAELTGDHTAWDVAITYTREGGARGIVAIEVKYSESGWEPVKELRSRYAELMPATGLFLDPTAPELRRAPIQQLMREHVLLQATIARGDYAEGRFIVIAPQLNRPMQSACRRYAAQLAEPAEGKAGFGVVTLEAFMAAMRKVGDEAYSDALFDRYIDWSQIDDAIEESFLASLAE